MLVKTLPIAQRLALARHPVSQQLLKLILTKKTNLALSIDVTDAHEVLHWADTLGDEICVLKTHVDILENFTPSFTQQLRALANKRQFLIFEDRKFADIGNTVKAQYAGGMYRIADWADIVNAHSLPGDGIVQGLADIGLPKQRGLLLLAEMSSRGHLMTPDYQHATVAMAKAHPDFVMGFITQHAHTENPGWINMTPGVHLSSAGDTRGQQYTTPETAILERGTDVIIVGRGILAAANPRQAARDYRAAGFTALQSRD